MSKDDTAVNDEVEQTTATESAPEEKQTVGADDLDNQLDKLADEIEAETPKATDSEDDATNVEEPAEETKQDTAPKEEKPSPEDEWNNLKGSSQDKFKQVTRERREALERIAELEARQAQFATEQDLLNEINPDTGDYYTPQEIERISWLKQREALNERTSQELVNLQIQQNQQLIGDEAQRVVKEIPLLNPESKDFVPEVGQQYADQLNDNLIYQTQDGQQVNRSTLLANGIDPDTQATLVGYLNSPYKIARTLSATYEAAQKRGETLGQAKAQKAAARMEANADAPASAAPVADAKEKDPILEGFNQPY